MSSRPCLRGIFFDLGDVLFEWSAKTATDVPAKTLRSIVASDIWIEYDCGRISQAECYCRAADHFSIEADELHNAFTQARNSLQPNHEMIAFIHELKKACGGMMKVFAMSNISKEDYVALAAKVADWNIFDNVFTSGFVGMRKPDTSFYRHALSEVGLSAEEVVFVDDKVANVRAAREIGFRGMVFNSNEPVILSLRKIMNDPFERGYRYLHKNGQRFDSITSTGITVPDNFARLLIQEITHFDGLVDANWDQKYTWNFFDGNPVLVPGGYFPDDLDTTSLALMVLQPGQEIVNSVLDTMLEYVHCDGKFQTYFDRSKPRTDEVVSANILACFYYFGRGHQLRQTLDMFHKALLHRTYIHGTRYYSYPDCCLYFFGRLLRASRDVALDISLSSLLKARVEERVGQSGNAIELAMRIITCNFFGIECRTDMKALLACQSDDGGWQASWMYRYGSTGVRLGNSGVTTALAVNAIASWTKHDGL